MNEKLIIKLITVFILVGIITFIGVTYFQAKQNNPERFSSAVEEENNIAPMVAIFGGSFSSLIAVFVSRRRKKGLPVQKTTTKQVMIISILVLLVSIGIAVTFFYSLR